MATFIKKPKTPQEQETDDGSVVVLVDNPKSGLALHLNKRRNKFLQVIPYFNVALTSLHIAASSFNWPVSSAFAIMSAALQSQLDS